MSAEVQKERIISGGVIFTPAEFEAYVAKPDAIELSAGENPPPGYKRCGRCKQVKKFYLFNRNSAALNNCTGNCKECQKEAAHASYNKNKGTRDYKSYYAANKEKKLAANKRYYEEHKEERAAKHKQYRASSKGKRVMKKAHNKRKAAMSINAGIPWTKEQVIERDRTSSSGELMEHPVCCLCGALIEVPQDIQMEHLIPIALGGADCFTNVGCAHTLCNLRKTKDAREIEVFQVERVQKMAYEYIEAHPEQFPQLFEKDDSGEQTKE